jgi:hypothetical protein
MTQKYICKESEKLDQLSTGQALVIEDMRTDHMVNVPLLWLTLICRLDEREGGNEEAANSRWAKETLR